MHVCACVSSTRLIWGTVCIHHTRTSTAHFGTTIATTMGTGKQTLASGAAIYYSQCIIFNWRMAPTDVVFARATFAHWHVHIGAAAHGRQSDRGRRVRPHVRLSPSVRPTELAATGCGTCSPSIRYGEPFSCADLWRSDRMQTLTPPPSPFCLTGCTWGAAASEL